MPQLTVSVFGQHEDARLLTLPFEVFAPNGRLLANGTASPRRVTTLDLPEQVRGSQDSTGPDRVHVVAKLPNGIEIQQAADLIDGRGEVTLRPFLASPHEWLQWVTPFHSLAHLQLGGNPIGNASGATPRRIGKVWMALWALEDGRWAAKGVDSIERQRDSGMQQFAIDVPRSPHLLQIGGEEVAWRLVSLPPGGPVRVALTRSASDEGDAVDITIGRRNPENELIMSYLARGAVSEADRLADAWNAADLMLQEKYGDPVSAVAGAYLLLKIKHLQERKGWVDNLVNSFPYMADGAIISAALALQSDDADEADVRAKILKAQDRGLPIFAMGAAILVETMAAIHRGKQETKRFHRGYLAAQAFARARCSKGAYFAFYGKSPAQPSWTPIYGLEGHPVASLASSQSTESVFFARPRGAILSGKFGGTTVSLPRAPVSNEMLEGLGIRKGTSANVELSEQVAQRELSLTRTKELGVPSLETSVLQEFSANFAAADLGAFSEKAPSQARSAPAPDNDLERALRPPRQTPKYWQKEREKHAVSLFGGDD